MAPGIPSTPENYGESKAAIDAATLEAAGGKAHLCRAGLIGGPRDSSDRYGYWPARFARDKNPVVPAAGHHPTQVIDVRDLAAWVLKAAGKGVAGALNDLGGQVTFGTYLAAARETAATAARSFPPKKTGSQARASATGQARTPCRSGSRPGMRALRRGATGQPSLPGFS